MYHLDHLLRTVPAFYTSFKGGQKKTLDMIGHNNTETEKEKEKEKSCGVGIKIVIKKAFEQHLISKATLDDLFARYDDDNNTYTKIKPLVLAPESKEQLQLTHTEDESGECDEPDWDSNSQ